MKIIVVGSTGTIGRAIITELKQRHTVVEVAHQHGDIHMDITDAASIENMYRAVGKFDAVVSATGKVHFGEFADMTAENYYTGIHSKLMGQVNLVLIGRNYINDSGSFTLTSGVLSHDPVRYGSSASMVNAALEGFARGAAIEMPRGLRINVVSPTVITESMPQFGDYFHGYAPISAAQAALAYSKSVEGLQTGQVYCVGY
jgi:NAD(P)-dependent dehydrogenase (short-subunit alcohol dehydrogenase family)